MSEPRLEPKLSPSSQSSPTTINNNENLLAELGRGGLVSSGWFGAGLFTPLSLKPLGPKYYLLLGRICFSNLMVHKALSGIPALR